MGEALPEGVSRQEFSELATGMKELREAVDELRKARTEPERREAREEVREAKSDLAATARELGIDPKRLEEAATAAKAEDEKKRLRPLLIELLDEELADPAAEAAGELGGAVEAAAEETAPAAPKPDSAPKMGHWSERPLSSLFGGSDG
jgi:outer membrane murein-binding lipoprotein Lpp